MLMLKYRKPGEEDWTVYGPNEDSIQMWEKRTDSFNDTKETLKSQGFEVMVDRSNMVVTPSIIESPYEKFGSTEDSTNP